MKAEKYRKKKIMSQVLNSANEGEALEWMAAGSKEILLLRKHGHIHWPCAVSHCDSIANIIPVNAAIPSSKLMVQGFHKYQPGCKCHSNSKKGGDKHLPLRSRCDKRMGKSAFDSQWWKQNCHCHACLMKFQFAATVVCSELWFSNHHWF